MLDLYLPVKRMVLKRFLIAVYHIINFELFFFSKWMIAIVCTQLIINTSYNVIFSFFSFCPNFFKPPTYKWFEIFKTVAEIIVFAVVVQL